MTILQEYSRAMIDNDIDKCVLIEEKYGLYGYPPELVSVGLKAVDAGLDPIVAVDDYIEAA